MKSYRKELLERLKSGAYGDKPLNVDENIWKKVMGKVDDEQEEEDEEEFEDDIDLVSGDEDDESDVGEVEYVEDSGDDELLDMEDVENGWVILPMRKRMVIIIIRRGIIRRRRIRIKKEKIRI